MNDNVIFYQQNKDSLIKQYDSVSFESVHKDWLDYLPARGIALDIGAGSGRDARFLAAAGLKVYAAEPASTLMQDAVENSLEYDIIWYQDSLPNLDKTQQLDMRFDLILLSAVWMHLTPTQRVRSMRTMATLVNGGGKVVITLRHGTFSDGRTAYPVDADEVISLASDNGLSVLLNTKLSKDQLGRGDVVWQTVVLTK